MRRLCFISGGPQFCHGYVRLILSSLRRDCLCYPMHIRWTSGGDERSLPGLAALARVAPPPLRLEVCLRAAALFGRSQPEEALIVCGFDAIAAGRAFHIAVFTVNGVGGL